MLIARPLWPGATEALASAAARLGSPVEPSAGAELVLLTGLDEAARAALLTSRPGLPRFFAGGRPDAGLLSGTRSELAQLRTMAPADLARALEGLERARRPPEATRLGGRSLEWGGRTRVMGVVNVTPDSFSDGGRFESVEAAVGHVAALTAAGADLIDIGGESTRPGAQPVTEAEELRRVLPVIEAAHQRFPEVPISIDTSRARVAREAIRAGAVMLNDVTGLRDEALVAVAAETGVAVCAMHMQGEPRTMQQQPAYDDVVAEVIEALDGALGRAAKAGVPRERVLVDPGIGFGKTFAHNLFLLRHLPQLRVLGAPLLVGTSRKAFLGALVNKPPPERAVASAASAAVMAVLGGADVVRAHDVAETRDALAVADAVRAAGDGGRLWG